MDEATMNAPVPDADVIGATKQLPAPGFIENILLTQEDLDQMLLFAVENGVDDVILLVGHRWGVIWSEKVVLLGQRDLTYEELESLLVDITKNRNAGLDLRRAEDVDFPYAVRVGRGQILRFRCNATGCLGPHGTPGMEIVFRPMGKVPPTMEQLGLPDEIKRNCMPKSGIVLICGPTGSGKTTLLDSIMRAQATHVDGRHILTYYAPIESDLLTIPNRTGMIAQGEIGREGYGAHLTEFSKAVRNSLRRHPMVIVYGEARDRETIEGAVLSSMTGHATYTTTHTSNVHMAIPRLGDAFSGADRVRITNGLIDNVRLIVHQRLLKKPNGIGRSPVRSWLVMTQEIRSHLLRTPIDQLPAAISDMTRRYGRDLLVDAQEQFEKGLIHEDEIISLRAELANEEATCL